LPILVIPAKHVP